MKLPRWVAALLIVLAGCTTSVRTLDLHVGSPPLLPMQRLPHGDAMETRSYRIVQGEFVHLSENMPQPSEADVRKFFEAKGIAFPTGSTFSTSFDGVSGLIVTRNTIVNLDKLERVLIDLHMWVIQVEIGVRLLEVSTARAVTALKERPISLPHLSKLLGQGIRIIDSTQTTTLGGIQSQVKNYFHWPSLPATHPNDSGNSNAPTTNEVCQSQLGFTPTVGADHFTINLALTLQSSIVVKKVNGEGLSSSAGTPDLSLETSVVIYDGQTLGFELPDHSGSGASDLWFLVTVRLVDATGTPVHSKKD